MGRSLRRRTTPAGPAPLPARDEAGFTLIELLVVIIIIGILAAIAIPVFLHQRTKGYEASEKSDLHTVAYEIESYYATTDDYTSVPFGSYTGAGPTHTISWGAAVNVGGDNMTLSKGNTATLLAAGLNGYCIGITNSNPTAQTWYFDSLSGGLTKTPCPAAGKTY